MNYDTESWYKLYIRESTEDKLLPVLNRALRDFLLRLAKSRTDATILGKTTSPGEDLARALGAHGAEAETIAAFVQSMLADGYLTHRKGRLWITNFVEAQEAKSPGARRQKTYRDKHPKSRTGDEREPTKPVDPLQHGDVTDNARVTLQEIRSEEIRSDPSRGDPTARAPGDFGLTTPDDELPDSWAPNAEHVALALRLGLNLDDELGIYRARRKRDGYRCGNWDADFEGWLHQGKKLQRANGPRRGTGSKTHGGPSDDWPTDADVSLREAIRGGAHGPKLKAKLEAGQLDAALAKRLVREREQELRDNREAANNVAALVGGIGRAAP